MWHSFAYSRNGRRCKATDREKRVRRPLCGVGGITAASGQEPAMKMPELAEIFALPNARIGATAAGARAAAVEHHLRGGRGQGTRVALPIPCHQR
jgi:hypothetical protein